MFKITKKGKTCLLRTFTLILAITLITSITPVYARIVKTVSIATYPPLPDGFIGETFDMECSVSTRGGPRTLMDIYWEYCSGEGCTNFGTIPTSGAGITCEASGCTYSGSTADYSDRKTITMNTVGNYRLRCYAVDSGNNKAYSEIEDLTVSKYGWLSVNLLSFTGSMNVKQYNTFWINASVTCEGGDFAKCGSVSGSARYGASGAMPNELISTTEGAIPLYILSSSSENYYYYGWNFNTFEPEAGDIETNGTYMWLVGVETDTIYRYWMDGTFDPTGNVSINDIYASAPVGLDFNGTHFFVSDNMDGEVYVFKEDGTYVWQFDVSGYVTVPNAVVFNGTHYFVAHGGPSDEGGRTVYRYDSSGNFEEAIELTSITLGQKIMGMDFYEGHRWVEVRDNDDEAWIYKFNDDWTYANYKINVIGQGLFHMGVALYDEHMYSWVCNETTVFRYTKGATNTQLCDPLDNGQSCELSWEVNATGAPNSSWEIDVNFDSEHEEIPDNDTSDSTVNIIPDNCYSDSECNDNNECTTDACDMSTKKCVFTPVSDGTLCNDGLWCTENDLCSAGICIGASRDCSDTVSCTADSCDENNDMCVNTPDNSFCSDGLFCNGEEMCNALSGCQPGSPVTCDDGESCTTDSCNEDIDACDYVWPSCGITDGCCGPGCNSGIDEDCTDECMPVNVYCNCNGKCQGLETHEMCPWDCP